jgi:MFS family permease
MVPHVPWRRRLGLERRVGALAAGLLVYGFGEELWFRYLPEYLRVLGASAFAVGLFGTAKDLLDAAYAYPGGVLSDRLGTRRSLLLFGSLTTAGFAVYFFWPSIPGVFFGLLLVLCWQSLGLPATFALIGEELEGGRRIAGFTVQAVLKRVPIVLAPPLGGLILERFGMRQGMRAGFGVSIVLSVVMLFALRRGLRKEERESVARVAPAPRPAGRSLCETRPSVAAGAEVRRGETPRAPPRGRERSRLAPALRQLLIADCLIRFCEGMPEVFLVIWVIEVVKVSPSRFGILTSVLMGTAIVSYLPAAALAGRAEKKWFVLLTYLFFSLFPLAVFLSRSFPALVGAFAIGGLREIGEPARKALIVDLSDPRARGRTVGVYYAIRGFSVAGAAAVGGALWMVNPASTFLVATALGLAGTAWTALFLRLPKETPAA